MSSSRRELNSVSNSTHELPSPTDIQQRQARVAATAAGAGSGTLVALIANKLSDDNWLKPWLVLIAPSISVTFSAIWVWLQTKFVNYIKEYEFKLLVAQAIKTIDEALQDPNLSQERVLELIKMRDELSQAKIERIMTKFRNIQITAK